MFRVSSSDDESSSTQSTPNDPPYVLRGGAAMTRVAVADLGFGFVLVSISSIRGLGFIDDDDDDDDVPFCPTVSHD